MIATVPNSTPGNVSARDSVSVELPTVGLTLPHHDGSERYVSNQNPRLGDDVDVLLRVPHTWDAAEPVTAVHVRTHPDGEQHFTQARKVATTDTDTWWKATLSAHNPVTAYRFLIVGGPYGQAWLNGTGLHRRELPDASDFRLVAHDNPPPAWSHDAVVYQIFPDRFARSAGADKRELPEWAQPAAWESPVDLRPESIAWQLYGGDLDGIIEHLDHIQSLGADVIYLTPFFPARSNHRYDASSFEQVDPILGGDAALRRLTKAAHARGMRVMGDFTTNHTGDAHEWFVAASGPGGAKKPERDFYIWEDGDYVAWLGVRTLPKLNHLSRALRDRIFQNPKGVVRHWLGRGGGLDGWRVDVANMTGRWRGTDVNHDVAREMREVMGKHAPDALLVGEHFHDYSTDLPGDGWHGAMNYSGFGKPVWSFLSRDSGFPMALGAPVPMPVLDAADAVETMRDFTSRIPWQTLVNSFNLVGSHDVARIRTLVGDDERLVEVAAGLLFTFPSVPMMTYGDEIGMEGAFGEDGRRPMPWDESDWDQTILGYYRDLIAVRKGSAALRNGGLRWVHADGDAMVFLRESRDETALVHISRAAHQPIKLATAGLPEIATGQAAYGRGIKVGTRTVSATATGPQVSVWTWKRSDKAPLPGGKRRK